MSGEPRDWNSPQYKVWRLAVYKRDHFTCQMPNCGKRGRLNAHHIRRWADHPELRFTVSNGVTLCRSHHEGIAGREDEYESIFLGLVGQSRTDVLLRLMFLRQAEEE